MSNEREEEIRRLHEEIEEMRRSLNRLSRAVQEEPEESELLEQEPEEKVDEEPEKPDLHKEAEEMVEEEPVEESEPEEYERGEEAYDERPRYRKFRRGRHYWDNFGDSLGEYISDFVEDVMEGVGAEIERSLALKPHIGRRHPRPRRITDEDLMETAKVMSALGNEHRLRVLEQLSMGGLYASDLQEALSEISPSTLSSHLDILEEAGLIVQERRRGRYLITMSGRVAIKMAYQVARRTKDLPIDL